MSAKNRPTELLNPYARIVRIGGQLALQSLVPLAYSAALVNLHGGSVDGLNETFDPTSRAHYPVTMRDGVETGRAVTDFKAIPLDGACNGATLGLTVKLPKSATAASVTASDIERLVKGALADFVAAASGASPAGVKATARARKAKGARGRGVTTADAITDMAVTAVVAQAALDGAGAGAVVGVKSQESGATVTRLAAGVSGQAFD